MCAADCMNAKRDFRGGGGARVVIVSLEWSICKVFCGRVQLFPLKIYSGVVLEATDYSKTVTRRKQTVKRVSPFSGIVWRTH